MVLVLGIRAICPHGDTICVPIIETNQEAVTSDEMMHAYLGLTDPETRESRGLDHPTFTHYSLGAVDEAIFN